MTQGDQVVGDVVADMCGDGELLVLCGPGGVGKTTLAAAVGTAMAARGRRVLVLTVDPARRLAAALGLADTGNVEVAVDVPGADGTLTMAMIDTHASWNDMIARHAPDAATRDRVLANELYTTLTSRFVHSHDYVVADRLYEAHISGKYDLIVVDTPPSRNALSILDAPKRMQQFFGSRLLRLLTSGGQASLLNVAARPFFLVADRILGARFLQDISEFFTLFRTLEAGVVSHARGIDALLGSPRTRYVIVASGEPVALREARHLVGALDARGMRRSAVVLNRLTPRALLAGLDESTKALASSVDSMRTAGDTRGANVLARALDAADRVQAAAQREAGAVATARTWSDIVACAEMRNTDPIGVDELMHLAGSLQRAD
jgi:anion-transporting  ArsA/GET3 family ATPase